MSDAPPATAEHSPDERGARVRHVAGVVSRRALIIAACAVLIPVAVYILVAVQPRQHRATALVQSGPLIPSSVLVEKSQVPTGWFQDPGGNAVALLAKTPAVRVEAANKLKIPPAQLGAIDTEAHQKTGWVTIGVKAGSSRAAVAGANVVAAATGDNLRLRTRRSIAVMTSALQSQLAQERSPTIRAAMRAQLAAFRAFRPQDAQPVQVIAPAVSSSAVSNNPGLAAAIALLFALYLGWRLARLAERVDDSIHQPEEAEQALGAAALALIPAEGNASPEPFLRLRDAILHLSGQGGRATLIVTSPRSGDGRTSVAIGLAKAYTAAGRSVVLVDADLRDPQVAARMVVAPEPGLADVLAGRDLSEALHVGMHPGLTLLPAGLPTSRSSDLAGSARMQTLIEELAVRFDIVIVDTPPLFAASDALALVNEASGAVVVARIDHTSRRSLGRAAQILKRAGAKVLGSAVTGINREAHRLPSALARPAEPREIVQAPGG